ncbi:MAG: hypothetical protein WC044_01530 [Crocinitomicaceae bacterium]
MAEYSKEFLDSKNWADWQPDFSVLHIFQQMKEGETVDQICEGFGFIAIKKLDNQCILIFRDYKISLAELTKI